MHSIRLAKFLKPHFGQSQSFGALGSIRGLEGAMVGSSKIFWIRPQAFFTWLAWPFTVADSVSLCILILAPDWSQIMRIVAPPRPMIAGTLPVTIISRFTNPLVENITGSTKPLLGQVQVLPLSSMATQWELSRSRSLSAFS